MKLSERCDEIVRLIDESLADLCAAVEAESERRCAPGGRATDARLADAPSGEPASDGGSGPS